MFGVIEKHALIIAAVSAPWFELRLARFEFVWPSVVPRSWEVVGWILVVVVVVLIVVTDVPSCVNHLIGVGKR